MDDLKFLDSSANGLDLSDAEDRAIFRQRVAYRLRATTVAAMREWLDRVVARDRVSASRAVADAYIAKHDA
ncbi:hypothetical protein 23F_00067 [Ralstonia phage Gerry]|uniref:Uncharacterized protein n=1 Tax=Ralstonia phage Gerry TaxID=2759727 RepID=A0A7G5BAA4_9CAUD|nr:hypothetical protein KMC47_gp56 [Ralstonia phage Gerry]QMV33227.1 hypothetical protein 23F_00067 [Ralstonia phage Gerry]